VCSNFYHSKGKFNGRIKVERRERKNTRYRLEYRKTNFGFEERERGVCEVKVLLGNIIRERERESFKTGIVRHTYCEFVH